jgi:hypothetical protein
MASASPGLLREIFNIGSGMIVVASLSSGHFMSSAVRRAREPKVFAALLAAHVAKPNVFKFIGAKRERLDRKIGRSRRSVLQEEQEIEMRSLGTDLPSLAGWPRATVTAWLGVSFEDTSIFLL